MNREIKFRGERLDNGEWIFGDLIENQGRFFIYHATSETTIEDDDDGRISIVAVEVDPSTVGQFTGMKDRNGMEIYEGDILHIPEIPYFKGGNGYVLFINDCISVKDGEEHEWRLTWVVQESDDGILGNIYDNPQLLNQ